MQIQQDKQMPNPPYIEDSWENGDPGPEFLYLLLTFPATGLFPGRQTEIQCHALEEKRLKSSVFYT